jgi:hypothetical protein
MKGNTLLDQQQPAAASAPKSSNPCRSTSQAVQCHAIAIAIADVDFALS